MCLLIFRRDAGNINQSLLFPLFIVLTLVEVITSGFESQENSYLFTQASFPSGSLSGERDSSSQTGLVSVLDSATQ